MRRAIREYGRFVIVIIAFAAISAAAGGYILIQQRLQSPFADRYTLHVELANSQALTPGLGQPVNVAGVRVGDITGVTLRNGRAVLDISIDPGKLRHVYSNAQAVFHPNTPLKDMQLEITPGGPPALALKQGATIPVAQTNVPVDTDELTAALDADTRTYFSALISATQGGLQGRGKDLRAVFTALGPTTEQLRTVGDSLAARRRQITRLVGNLALLTKAASGKDRELGQLVDAGNATVQAFASQDVALRESIRRLPGTLAAARSSLANATTFSNQLGPTLTALQPAARGLAPALRATRPLLAQADPLVRRQLAPFVREAQPLARDLAPTVSDLSATTPDLISSFKVLNYVANELVFNPRQANDQGFLFWLAWFTHNASSVMSTQDANGVAWRGLGLVSCQTIASVPAAAPILSAILGSVPACP